MPGVTLRLSRKGRARSNKRTHEENLTTVLLTLYRLGKASYTEISEASGLSSQDTFSRALRELVEHELASREEAESRSFYELTSEGKKSARQKEKEWWRHAIDITQQHLARFLYEAEPRLTPVRPGTKFRERVRIMLSYVWKKAGLFREFTNYLVSVAYLKAAAPSPLWGEELLSKVRTSWRGMDKQRFLKTVRETAEIGMEIARKKTTWLDMLTNDVVMTMLNIPSRSPWARRVYEDAVRAFTREQLWLHKELISYAESSRKWVLMRDLKPLTRFFSAMASAAPTAIIAGALWYSLTFLPTLILHPELAEFIGQNLLFVLVISLYLLAIAYEFLGPWIPLPSPELRFAAMTTSIALISTIVAPLLINVPLSILLITNLTLIFLIFGAVLGFADRIKRNIRRHTRYLLKSRQIPSDAQVIVD